MEAFGLFPQRIEDMVVDRTASNSCSFNFLAGLFLILIFVFQFVVIINVLLFLPICIVITLDSFVLDGGRFSCEEARMCLYGWLIKFFIWMLLLLLFYFFTFFITYSMRSKDFLWIRSLLYIWLASS